MLSLSKLGLPHPLRSSVYVAAAVVGLVCCSSSETERSTTTSSGSSAATSAESSEDLYVFGPWWEKAASTKNPLDVAELGQREGGAGLVRGLEDARYAEVSRLALPDVADNGLAIGALARRLRAAGSDAEEDGETLVAVLRAPPRIGERLDPEGETKAREDLLALANDGSAPRKLRALAVTALRQLAARGVGDEAAIPTDLDEP
ncbi:MAG: hypothetical protein HOW73_39995 [Polyangiaceae bacterium]|nr:hypothetical protein [Polyangiaceae bacterium]